MQFLELLNYPDMDQVLAAIFPAKDLRFDVIQGDSQADVGIVLVRVGIGFDVRVQGAGVGWVASNVTDQNRNLRVSFSFVERVREILQFFQADALTSVNDELWSVGFFDTQGAFLCALAEGKYGGRVRIFPALLVPVSDMFAEHDHLGARNWLVVVQTL